MNLRESWILFAIGSAFFAGLTAVLGKIGVQGIPSNLATMIRTVVILAVTAGIVTLLKEWRPAASIPARTWIFLALSGIATGLSWLCYFRALQLGPVTRVAPVDKLSVAFAILLGVLFLGEKPTLPVVVGALLIVLGSIVMIAF